MYSARAKFPIITPANAAIILYARSINTDGIMLVPNIEINPTMAI